MFCPVVYRQGLAGGECFFQFFSWQRWLGASQTNQRVDVESPSKGMFQLSKPARYYMVDLAFLRGLTWIQDSIERSHKKNVISSSSSTLWGGNDGNFCLSFLAAPPVGMLFQHCMEYPAGAMLNFGGVVWFSILLYSLATRRWAEVNQGAVKLMLTPGWTWTSHGIRGKLAAWVVFWKVCRYYTSPHLFYTTST